jgi:hypothetical protein
MNPLTGRYPLTQSWEAHLRNAGPTLGGEDYAMPVGTRLPDLGGDVEYVAEGQRTTLPWYNAGLGNAVCFRRADGSGTVMGHLSGIDGRVPLSGNSGRSTGPHVHVHDIDTDGYTRLRPFSGAEQEEPPMFEPKVIVRTDGTPEASLVAPWLEGETPLERGYILFTNPDDIRALARTYAGGVGHEHARVTRDDGYTDIQAVARVVHAQWKRAFANQPQTAAPLKVSLTGTATPE